MENTLEIQEITISIVKAAITAMFKVQNVSSADSGAANCLISSPNRA